MKNKLAVFTSAVVIGGLLATGGSVWAKGNKGADFKADFKKESKPRTECFELQKKFRQPRGWKLQKGSGKFKFVEDLLKDGVITEDVADKINTYIKQKQEEMKKEHKEKLAEMQAKQQEWMKSQLDKLVTDGKITQEQEVKILAAIQEKQEALKAEMDKIKNMTAEERKAYFESKKDQMVQKVDIVGELVNEGIITQDQAQDVRSAIRPWGFGGGMPKNVPKKRVPMKK